MYEIKSQENKQDTYICLMLYENHRKVVTGVLQDMPSANQQPRSRATRFEVK